MTDDWWDADHNGIPDSIQRDPVVAPEPAAGSSEADQDARLPGINAPIDPPAEPAPDPSAVDPETQTKVYEIQQDVTASNARTADRAFSEMDGYIRD